MSLENIVQELKSLPPELQKEAADFIEFLHSRSKEKKDKLKHQPALFQLSKQPFIGMWKDRKDMNDSAAWVRDLRQKEW